MSDAPAIDVQGLSHHYGTRQALAPLDVQIGEGEIFAFVGPNGGGKTTLFRVLSTLLPPQAGSTKMLGFDLATQATSIRANIGVVFQAASLDKKLTVAENLRHQGHLYGISGSTLTARIDELLASFSLSDRAGEKAELLSGGLRRRVELAKGLLHQPRIVLLDEPSTGLDPLARLELWSYLEKIREEQGATILLTTHILEEADKADRVAILHHGKLAALDAPSALKASLGGDTISITTERPREMVEQIRSQLSCPAEVIGERIRLESTDGTALLTRLVEAFPGQIDSVTFARPSLEDVFVERTGSRFTESDEEVSDGK